MTHRSGRHFLQIPGPTNVPDRVLRAMDRPTIDHRGPEFATLFSLPAAWFAETTSAPALQAAPLPVLYNGLVCGAFAFTLQILAQRHAPPAHAAILMSLESVFAALFGWLLLDERLGPRGLAGASLMFAGMLVSQWSLFRRHARPT